jgi:hypothetical protein
MRPTSLFLQYLPARHLEVRTAAPTPTQAFLTLEESESSSSQSRGTRDSPIAEPCRKFNMIERWIDCQLSTSCKLGEPWYIQSCWIRTFLPFPFHLDRAGHLPFLVSRSFLTRFQSYLRLLYPSVSRASLHEIEHVESSLEAVGLSWWTDLLQT